MRRAGVGAAALLLLLATCTGTITTSSHWSGSWEESFSVAVLYGAGELESILVDVNGAMLPPLAVGESSARVSVHRFDLSGVYLAIASETDGLLWEETADFAAADGDRLLLTITSLSAAAPAAVTYTLERVP